MNENAYITGLIRKLYYTSIAVLANSLLSILLPGLSHLVALGLSGYCVYLLFQLKLDSEHYKKAAIFYTVALVGSLVGRGILAVAGTICSIVAQYQEYHGHGELVAPWDPKLQSRWSGLFWFQFAATIIFSLFTGMVTAVLMIVLVLDEATMNVIITIAVAVVSVILNCVYLAFLKRTIRALEADVAVV